ncbi:hypothetical protein C5B90_13070 [Haloferax sp. Atlit-12N]|uniref:hypothetical protein n=1 Tax=Haloferax sp. Atlit-12N TaxID=2077203 RepID=UPI000E254571|nr:hypothetical protein [Haloferax sp. Atlit-12N]RDZ64027.1 hypothetical protein C5B90_13070 [Haloferax sp. Atlit-12N]
MPRSQINIKVNSETKEEWDEFVEEEQEVGSLTELIRRSVEDFISAHYAESSEEGLEEEVFLQEIESLRGDIDTVLDAVKSSHLDQLSQGKVREASVEANEELWEWYYPQIVARIEGEEAHEIEGGDGFAFNNPKERPDDEEDGDN